MKSTYKYLFRIAIVAITAVLFCAASCEKSEKVTNNKAKDTNPYSETRNEGYSMLGFEWNGKRFIQSTYSYLMRKTTKIQWNIVEIDKEEFILVRADMESVNSVEIHIPDIWLIIPYQDVELNTKYISETAYLSFVEFSSYNPFIVDGKEVNFESSTLIVTVEYTMVGDKIQGKFSAEGGLLETVKGEKINVMFSNGVFNLNKKSSMFNQGYSLETWLSEIESAKSYINWRNSNRS